MERSKEDILESYKSRDLNLFIQYDCLDHQDGDDDLMKPGKEEHCVTSGLTYELMSKEPDVRVLIPAGTSMETALRLIDKIKESISKSGGSWNYQLEIEEAIISERLEYWIVQKELDELISTHDYTYENLNHMLSTIKIIRDKNELDVKRKKDELAKQLKLDAFDIPL
jgi:hypothetical protein